MANAETYVYHANRCSDAERAGDGAAEAAIAAIEILVVEVAVTKETS